MQQKAPTLQLRLDVYPTGGYDCLYHTDSASIPSKYPVVMCFPQIRLNGVKTYNLKWGAKY